MKKMERDRIKIVEQKQKEMLANASKPQNLKNGKIVEPSELQQRHNEENQNNVELNISLSNIQTKSI